MVSKCPFDSREQKLYIIILKILYVSVQANLGQQSSITYRGSKTDLLLGEAFLYL